MAEVIFPNFKLTSSVDMPVNGQGIFTFNIARNTPFLIAVRDQNCYMKCRIWLEVHLDCVKLMRFAEGHVTQLSSLHEPSCGIDPNSDLLSYWLSYDRDLMCLKYGKGYYMDQTTLLKHDFLEGLSHVDEMKTRQRYWQLFNAEGKKVVELYDHATCGNVLMVAPTARGDIECPIVVARTPLVANPSPLVLDTKQVSLLALDSNKYMLAGSLPAACKELYDNISNCELDVSTNETGHINHELSDAIRHSIKTKGCILHEKIKEKALAQAMGPNDPKKTYLRVTLGSSFGNSPGIPYVLEIWPSGHYSPIHNHGGASAVIKVLHGSINVTCYNKNVQSVDGGILCEFDAHQGDITWMDRNWYQTHKLHNKTGDYCATIQCYNYASDDSIHWPYFEYVKCGTYRNQFLPNSDFKFTEMRNKVMQELQGHITATEAGKGVHIFIPEERKHNGHPSKCP